MQAARRDHPDPLKLEGVDGGGGPGGHRRRRGAPGYRGGARDLAMRIAGGEVDDLRARLPVQFQAALDRGRRLSGGKAMRMRLDDFVRRVAEQEGISLPRAREHVSAVPRTVREAVGEQELLDATSQLPAEYEALVRR